MIHGVYTLEEEIICNIIALMSDVPRAFGEAGVPLLESRLMNWCSERTVNEEWCFLLFILRPVSLTLPLALVSVTG